VGAHRGKRRGNNARDARGRLREDAQQRRVPAQGLGVQGFGFGVGVSGFGFRVQGSGFGFLGLRFAVWCLVFRVQGARFGVRGDVGGHGVFEVVEDVDLHRHGHVVERPREENLVKEIGYRV